MPSVLLVGAWLQITTAAALSGFRRNSLQHLNPIGAPLALEQLFDAGSRTRNLETDFILICAYLRVYVYDRANRGE